MIEENKTPEWIESLGKAMASMYEWQAPAYVDWFFSEADENGWGIDLIELYPAWTEIEEAGPNDGEIVFPKVNGFDILEAQKTLDEVNSVTFGFELDDLPSISLEGKYKGHEIIVMIYFEPVSDSEGEEAD